METIRTQTHQQVELRAEPPDTWTIVTEVVEPVIMQLTELQEAGHSFKNNVHDLILQGGTPARLIMDVLHGVWLGHPLHPVLTDVTIGAWLFGSVFDWLSLMKPSRAVEQAADTLTTIGTASAVPTAIAGFADYTTVKGAAVKHGAIHGMMNGLGLMLYLASIQARRSNNRPAAIALSSLALALLTPSAWLGGDMVYRLGVGTDHAERPRKSEKWTTVMRDPDLAEQIPQRVDVDGTAVLLYRLDGQIHAIGAVCAHAGGPLEEGSFENGCVQCPWHDSVYDLRDGRVVHGPTTFPQPAYDVRVQNGQIAVRFRPVA